MKILIIGFAAWILLSGCDLINSVFGYGDENSITIKNSSFENPSVDLTDNGLLNGVDDWIEGGSWYGRWRWAGGVVDGEYAVWSSFVGGGADNGFSQELDTIFEAGQYSLSIKSLGDNTDGLTSRLIIGYDAGNDDYVELSHQDTSISYDREAEGFTIKEAWFDQEVVVKVTKASKAIGKPIWIRFTTTTGATGNGGNSCWWDDVSLSVAYPIIP